MEINQLESCCGIGDMSDIRMELEDEEEGYQTPAGIINQIKSDMTKRVWRGGEYVQAGYEAQYGLMLITDNIAEGNGQRLVRFIRKEKLGRVVSSPVAINPKHNTKIKCWVWAPNWPSVFKYGEPKSVARRRSGKKPLDNNF